MMPEPRIHITLTPGPLLPATPTRSAHGDGGGAVVTFEGIVRPLEGDRPLRSLRYEQYDPMTQRKLERLALACIDEFGLLRLTCEHSVGDVAPGECSFRLTITSPHRGPALQATAAFIDRMKRDVPLWKVPVYAGGEP